MMRVSQYHKYLGDEVKIYVPEHKQQTRIDGEMDFDKIYAFSLFDFTDKSKVTKDMICGGSGFDLTTKLPLEIEKCDYDWSLYPNCDYSLIWFSKGCIRRCGRKADPYCVVRDKEGYIQPVEPKNLNPRGKYIKIMDNNFFANPKWHKSIDFLNEWGQPVDMEQGLDLRILDQEKCRVVNNLKIYKNKKGTLRKMKCAWDNPREDMLKHIHRVLKIYQTI